MKCSSLQGTRWRIEVYNEHLRLVVVLAVLVLGTAPIASAKFGLSLVLSQDETRVDVVVPAELRADDSVGKDCAMWLISVDPRSNPKALNAFLNGRVTIIGTSGATIRKIRSYSRIGFLVSMKRSGARTWRAQLRFPRAGRWHLIVPNWCAPGYAAALPIDRVITVRK